MKSLTLTVDSYQEAVDYGNTLIVVYKMRINEFGITDCGNGKFLLLVVYTVN